MENTIGIYSNMIANVRKTRSGLAFDEHDTAVINATDVSRVYDVLV